jgi:hypothetical protein
MKKIAAIILLSVFSLFAQSATSPEAVARRLERVEKIYRGLEYNTTSFNDLKQKWIITDPTYIREIFNRFVVKNALRINGRKPTIAEIEKNAQHIYDADVFIDLRRRFYDDEIEVIRFFREPKMATADSSDYFFDPVTDYIFIKDILGNELYQDMKKQMYALNDITKTSFDYKPGYNFNIYMHLYRPEVMFWSTTTDDRNKYMVSAFGNWGNDHISFPGWYLPDYVAGFRLAYADSIVNSVPIVTYTAEAGIGIPTIFPDLGMQNTDSGRKLVNSGTGFYLKTDGKFLKAATPSLSNLNISLETYFTVGTKDGIDFKVPVGSRFFSNRNYVDLFFTEDNIVRLSDWGTFYAGIGTSAFDVKYYEVTSLTNVPSLAVSNFENGFRYAVASEIGLHNTGGLLSHNVGVLMNYNISEETGYLGLKASLMISNVFGAEFKIMSPIKMSSKASPAYRPDTYLVFSPIIRINY